MLLSQKPAFYIRDTLSELFLLQGLPTPPSCWLSWEWCIPPHSNNWIMASVPWLFAVQRREVVYYIPKGMGAAVVSVHCLRGSTDSRPVLHSLFLMSLLGLGCSSTIGEDSHMTTDCSYLFFQRENASTREEGGCKGAISYLMGLKLSKMKRSNRLRIFILASIIYLL